MGADSRHRSDLAAGSRRLLPGRRNLFLIALLTLPSMGCSVVRPGVFSHPSDASDYIPADRTVNLDASESRGVYQKVREAAAQNSIVLQVVDDEEPLRVLPLPPPGSRSVFVSDLLEQTGVRAKLAKVEATLFRNSPDAIGGIRMEVKMNEDFDAVRPESDYALKPGDRLQVRKAKLVALGKALDTFGFDTGRH